MTAVPDWDVVSDAELAGAAATGDRVAFAGIYDRYADRLHDFCVGMVRDRDAAADCVQDTFCTAATRLSSLRDPDKLRPWLYAIARNEALRRIRERRREQPSDDLPEATSGEPGPEAMAARTELAALIAQVAGGLSDRDRAVLELTYRHGLDGPELADALGVSVSGARTLTHRLRETIERSLGALLVARRARTGQGCADLGALLADWDGQFTILMRKRIARHIDSCPTCEDQRGRLANPVALLGGAPLFIPCPAGLRERTLDRIQLVSAETDLIGPAASSSAAGSPGGSRLPAGAAAVAGLASAPDPRDVADDIASGAADSQGEKRRRRGLVPFLLLGAAVIAALGLTLFWPFRQDTSLTPVVVSETPSQPSPTPSAKPTTQAPPSAPPTVTAATIAPPTYERPTVVPFVPPVADPSTPSKSAAPVAPRIPRATTGARSSAPPTVTARPPTPPTHSGGNGTSKGSGGSGGSTGGGSTGGGSTGGGSTGGGSTSGGPA